MLTGVILFATGSPVVAELEESLDRAGIGIAAGIRNRDGASIDGIARPLRLRDMSRFTWLRDFFVNVNGLSAPTAMIRRHAYRTVGSYDRRLTNMRDFEISPNCKIRWRH